MIAVHGVDKHAATKSCRPKPVEFNENCYTLSQDFLDSHFAEGHDLVNKRCQQVDERYKFF